MADEYPKFLGEVQIPTAIPNMNKARFCRHILNELKPGKASVYEFPSKDETKNHRSMLYSMSILKFGEAGHIGTHLVETLLYVWLI